MCCALLSKAVIECSNEQQLVPQVIEKPEQLGVNQCWMMCNIMFYVQTLYACVVYYWENGNLKNE